MSPLFDRIAALIKPHLDRPDAKLAADTPLIGETRALSSMALVEVCLALEDLADELGFEFDWTSEHAMSRSRGIFRSVGALIEEFESQQTGRGRE